VTELDDVIRIGKTERLIYEKLHRDGFLYFVLVDPEKPGDLKELSRTAVEEGVSGFFIEAVPLKSRPTTRPPFLS